MSERASVSEWLGKSEGACVSEGSASECNLCKRMYPCICEGRCASRHELPGWEYERGHVGERAVGARTVCVRAVWVRAVWRRAV